MSNHHFKEKGLSLKAKGLLSLMLSLPDDWNYSISGLVRLSKDGKDSVMSALLELEKYGYLNRERVTNSKGQFSGVEYNIFEEPQQGKPIADLQNEEKQKSDKANAEKRIQLNTNISNNKKNKDNKELNTESGLEVFEDILKHIEDLEIRNLLIDYIEMRRLTGYPLTQRGLNMIINRCVRLSNFDRGLQKEMLENAIINNWRNVYLPKEQEPEIKIDNEEGLKDLKKFYGE
jgi:hypothetical protein